MSSSTNLSDGITANNYDNHDNKDDCCFGFSGMCNVFSKLFKNQPNDAFAATHQEPSSMGGTAARVWYREWQQMAYKLIQIDDDTVRNFAFPNATERVIEGSRASSSTASTSSNVDIRNDILLSIAYGCDDTKDHPFIDENTNVTFKQGQHEIWLINKMNVYHIYLILKSVIAFAKENKGQICKMGKAGETRISTRYKNSKDYPTEDKIEQHPLYKRSSAAIHKFITCYKSISGCIEGNGLLGLLMIGATNGERAEHWNSNGKNSTCSMDRLDCYYMIAVEPKVGMDLLLFCNLLKNHTTWFKKLHDPRNLVLWRSILEQNRHKKVDELQQLLKNVSSCPTRKGDLLIRLCDEGELQAREGEQTPESQEREGEQTPESQESSHDTDQQSANQQTNQEPWNEGWKFNSIRANQVLKLLNSTSIASVEPSVLYIDTPTKLTTLLNKMIDDFDNDVNQIEQFNESEFTAGDQLHPVFLFVQLAVRKASNRYTPARPVIATTQQMNEFDKQWKRILLLSHDEENYVILGDGRKVLLIKRKDVLSYQYIYSNLVNAKCGDERLQIIKESEIKLALDTDSVNEARGIRRCDNATSRVIKKQKGVRGNENYSGQADYKETAVPAYASSEF